MKTLTEVRVDRDALVQEILEWPIIKDNRDDEYWMNDDPEKFLGELCECKKDWLENWREYEEEIADNAPELSKDWSLLRELIESVRDLEAERIKR